MMRLFGIIGSPIDHSLSPLMHAAAFRALKLDACYAPFEVPKSAVTPVLEGLMLAGVEGLNVTVPLKESVLPLMDRLDPAAKAIGAVNTVVIRNRKMTGYNTDAAGFMRALKDLGWPRSTAHRSQSRRQAVVLGAGGAARAVCWVLARQGVSLAIANRKIQRAEKLCRWLRRARKGSRIKAVPLRSVCLEEADLLVNATSVGMRPGDPSPVDVSLLHKGLCVYDLVYNRPTRLVGSALRRGCVASDGLSMLLYQGAESLRLWVRRAPPVGAMRKALMRAVEA